MSPKVSVIICSYNPRPQNLSRVLAALQVQTLPLNDWELILVDNASNQPLANYFDLRWHTNSRCVLETELGLTPARLRGSSEAKSDLLVFVDDDNVLAPDYLERALQIANDHKHIGAFGGSIVGEFEQEPEPWLVRYLSYLAVCEINSDSWSNSYSCSQSTPVGAGLCVRRAVSEDFRQKVEENSKRRALDRVGLGTGSGGDTDLAYCSIDLGMGTGRFCGLKLTHLIPKERMSAKYMCRLVAGLRGSTVLLRSFRTTESVASKQDRIVAMVRFLLKLTFSSRIDRQMTIAAYKGRRKAEEFLRSPSCRNDLLQHY